MITFCIKGISNIFHSIVLNDLSHYGKRLTSSRLSTVVSSTNSNTVVRPSSSTLVLVVLVAIVAVHCKAVSVTVSVRLLFS